MIKFTENQLKLIELVVSEKMKIFDDSPNMWKEDQREYKKILLKLSKLEHFICKKVNFLTKGKGGTC